MRSAFGASTMGLLPSAARLPTWRTSKYHGNYLSRCKDCQAWPDAPKGTDKILGATIVAEHAGDMINIITLAMTKSIGLGSLAAVIHPYPTLAEAVKQTADAYNRTRLTPFLKSLFKWTLARRR